MDFSFLRNLVDWKVKSEVLIIFIECVVLIVCEILKYIYNIVSRDVFLENTTRITFGYTPLSKTRFERKPVRTTDLCQKTVKLVYNHG